MKKVRFESSFFLYYNVLEGDIMFIDTHCHLSKEDYEDISSVIDENRIAGVDKVIISGCTKQSIVESLQLSVQYKDVYVTIGYHPSEADIITDDDITMLEKQIFHDKVVGIGEIGLDYHYGKDNMEAQKQLFRKQLSIADKFQLPVVIHSRDATKDTIDILREFPNVIGDIHCFSGSVETAKIYISMGYKIGIGGVVTFKNSRLFEVVQEIGISSILLETDSPYLTPEPFRGKKNSSKYIPFIAEKIGELLNLSINEIGEITSNNAIALFDLK